MCGQHLLCGQGSIQPKINTLVPSRGWRQDLRPSWEGSPRQDPSPPVLGAHPSQTARCLVRCPTLCHCGELGPCGAAPSLCHQGQECRLCLPACASCILPGLAHSPLTCWAELGSLMVTGAPGSSLADTLLAVLLQEVTQFTHLTAGSGQATLLRCPGPALDQGRPSPACYVLRCCPLPGAQALVQDPEDSPIPVLASWPRPQALRLPEPQFAPLDVGTEPAAHGRDPRAQKPCTLHAWGGDRGDGGAGLRKPQDAFLRTVTKCWPAAAWPAAPCACPAELRPPARVLLGSLSGSILSLVPASRPPSSLAFTCPHRAGPGECCVHTQGRLCSKSWGRACQPHSC